MGQSSGPLTNQLFSNEEWRTLIGAEPGIVGDVDGSAYTLTLPSSSNTVLVGSATQRSASSVAGFAHTIPAGETEPVTIPDAVGGTVVFKIVARYNPAWAAEAPGPVRLEVLPGTAGGGAPASDGSWPGVEEMPLWQLTRAPGQALSQITPVDLRVHTGPTLQVPTASALPLDVPVGTCAWVGRGGSDFRCRVVTSATTGTVEWVRATPPLLVTGGVAGRDHRVIAGSKTVLTDAGGVADVVFDAPFPTGIISVTATLAPGVGVSDPHYASLALYGASSGSVARRPRPAGFTVRIFTPGEPGGAAGMYEVQFVAVGF